MGRSIEKIISSKNRGLARRVVENIIKDNYIPRTTYKQIKDVTNFIKRFGGIFSCALGNVLSANKNAKQSKINNRNYQSDCGNSFYKYKMAFRENYLNSKLSCQQDLREAGQFCESIFAKAVTTYHTSSGPIIQTIENLPDGRRVESYQGFVLSNRGFFPKYVFCEASKTSYFDPNDCSFAFHYLDASNTFVSTHKANKICFDFNERRGIGKNKFINTSFEVKPEAEQFFKNYTTPFDSLKSGFYTEREKYVEQYGKEPKFDTLEFLSDHISNSSEFTFE